MVDIKVWGEYACFTRPEFKVERMTYPVITPSAARGILEAIYWKPEMRYRITQIGILEQGMFFSMLRNEIKSRQAPPKNRPARHHYLIADDSRAQRTSLILAGRWADGQYRPIAYRIQACIELRRGETNIGKHLDCFRRRVDRGQFFQKPYLGCREFAADFSQATETDLPEPGLSFAIGPMLFDCAYIEDADWHADHPEDQLSFWSHTEGSRRQANGYADRIFFNAHVKNGWLKVPRGKFLELLAKEARDGAS